MTPFAATVRYRFSEGDGGRDASFHGLFSDRSEQAVLHRLEEAHRFADWVEVVEVRWRGDGAAAREVGRDDRQYSVPSRDRRGCAFRQARGGGAWSGGAQAETIARDDAAGEARGEGEWRPRRHARSRMFKPAQIAFGGSVHDCVLLNASPFGAHACLRAFVEVPALVTLRLPAGACQPVRRRWQEGRRVGFETVGTAPLMAFAA